VICEIPISKQDVGGAEINGAVLTITNASGFNNDLSGVTVTQNGQPASGLTVTSTAISFTTVASSSAIISGLPVGTYVLTETVVPIGYVVAESITFRVDTEGNVWVAGTPEEQVKEIIMIDKTDPSVSQVLVDGVEVSPENYTVNPDKTITLKDEYTKTLTAGTHKITVKLSDGTTAESTITITASASKVPATGESVRNLSLFIGLAMIASGIAVLVIRRKYRNEENKQSE
jgi:LPXTG-motif cell wall-anchored protein